MPADHQQMMHPNRAVLGWVEWAWQARCSCGFATDFTTKARAKREWRKHVEEAVAAAA